MLDHHRILGAVILFYVSAALQDPGNTLTYVLIFACLAVIFIQWYNPKRSGGSC